MTSVDEHIGLMAMEGVTDILVDGIHRISTLLPITAQSEAEDWVPIVEAHFPLWRSFKVLANGTEVCGAVNIEAYQHAN